MEPRAGRRAHHDYRRDMVSDGHLLRGHLPGGGIMITDGIAITDGIMVSDGVMITDGIMVSDEF